MTPEDPYYEIRVAENLECYWQQWFLGLEILPTKGQGGPGTLLRGNLPDQAALFGLLGRIHSLNLTLLEVKRIKDM